SAALWDRTLPATPAQRGLWNTYAGKIQGSPAVGGTPIDFGSASDGAFFDGPAQAGISVAGNLITFDTNQKAEFHFSSFTLSAGMTLTATGAAPLRIRVLGPTSILGT